MVFFEWYEHPWVPGYADAPFSPPRMIQILPLSVNLAAALLMLFATLTASEWMIHRREARKP
jgi:hypothetical protein